MTESPASPSLSGPVEDYLKAIYDLERGARPATTNEIALRLAVSPASVSGMVRRLADQGLITHERYRGVRLTEDGRRAALRTLRRHRILECYLTEILGYPWDRVHDEAEQLEHAASEELIERMATALGDPSHDPHGAPIPSREGEVDETTLRALADTPVGERVRVRQVMDKDAERLRYLAELGIRPGAMLRVVERAPFDGPITLGVGPSRGGVTRVIGPQLAEQVFVEPSGAE